MEYFDHSTDASTDTELTALRLEFGGAAVDAYWYVIEQMHKHERPLCVGNALAMRAHCHALCTNFSTLEKWLEAMVSLGLLRSDEKGENLTSPRALRNIEAYKGKREKAMSAAKSRWDKADAKQPQKRTQCKRNADALPTKQNKTKVSSALASTTKPCPSGDAASAEAAPPPGKKYPFCPLCKSKLWHNPQTGRFDCASCLDSFDAGKAVWR